MVERVIGLNVEKGYYSVNDSAPLVDTHHLQAVLQLSVIFILANVHHFSPLKI